MSSVCTASEIVFRIILVFQKYDSHSSGSDRQLTAPRMTTVDLTAAFGEMKLLSWRQFPLHAATWHSYVPRVLDY